MLESGSSPAPGACVRIGRVLGLLLLAACSLEAGSTGAPGAPSSEPVGHEPPLGEQDASELVVEEADAEPEPDGSASTDGGSDGALPLDSSTALLVTDAQALLDAAQPPDTGVDPGDAQLPGDASLSADTSLAEDAAQPLDAQTPGDAGPPPDAGPPRCSLAGSFAAEVAFNVQWKGTTLGGVVPVIAAGSGVVRMLVRMDSVEAGGRTTSTLSACSGQVPDFSASWLIGEVYSVEIPDRIWDQPTIPRWYMGWDSVCSAASCGLRSQLVVATLGARAATSDMWPGRTGPISQITPVDHDNDMLTALTLVARGPDRRNPSGKPYDEPPISWTLGSRASNIFTAFQLAGRLEANFSGCDSFSGGISEGKVEARALGCIAHRDGETAQFSCSRAQAEFLDENFPHWVVTGGTVRARRIAPELTCKEIRALWQ
jgi:hypothetical protein